MDKLREVVDAISKHYTVHVDNPEYPEYDRILKGWSQCVCGEAKADGTREYRYIWAEHIEKVASAEAALRQQTPAVGEAAAKLRRTIEDEHAKAKKIWKKLKPQANAARYQYWSGFCDAMAFCGAEVRETVAHDDLMASHPDTPPTPREGRERGSE
jgi:hypothetical protein